MYSGLNVKYPLVVSDFKETRICSANSHISVLMKVRSVRPELLHVDAQMDGQTEKRTNITKLIRNS
jgi:hypothetical protein